MASGARRILLNTAATTLPNLVGSLGSFLLYIVMARKLGAGEFGVFTFGLSFAALVTELGSFGQDWTLTRAVARDRTQIDKYFANTLGLKFAVTVPVLVCSLVVLSVISNPHTVLITGLLGVGLVLDTMTNTCVAAYQAYERMYLVPFVRIPQRLLTAFVGIGLLFAGVGVEGVALLFVVTAATALMVALSLLFSRVVRPKLTFQIASWRGLMWAAVPLGIVGVAALVLFRVDTVMLAAFEPSAVVGNYGAAYRLFEATLFVSWAVGAAVFPVFSRLKLTSEPSVGFVYERSLKLLTALTLPFAVAAAVLADPLVHFVYGHQYDEAVTALRLLAPAIALYPFAYVAGDLLVAQMRQRVVGIVYIALALENILLNLVLIPTWSLNGAAVGTSISQFLVAASLVYFSIRTVGSLDWSRILAGPLLASLVSGLVMGLLRDDFAPAVIAGGLLYVLVLLTFERLTFPEDVRVVFHLGRRGFGRLGR